MSAASMLSRSVGSVQGPRSATFEERRTARAGSSVVLSQKPTALFSPVTSMPSAQNTTCSPKVKAVDEERCKLEPRRASHAGRSEAYFPELVRAHRPRPPWRSWRPVVDRLAADLVAKTAHGHF